MRSCSSAHGVRSTQVGPLPTAESASFERSECLEMMQSRQRLVADANDN